VDDLLIVYNVNKTDTGDLLNCFNNLTTKLNFTIQKETRGSINFLDITIHREKNNFSVDIYRKPTYTDSIIPSDSCHPTEHKYAAIRYLHNRMNTYQLFRDEMEKENKIIQDILHNNRYNAYTLKSTSSSKNMNVGWKKHTGLSSRTSARRPEPSRKYEKILE
jgi:hypothetical protein